MTKGKSSGIDGLTFEVFLHCWFFMENDFFTMLIHFWETGELYPDFNEGVLKLIPKKSDRCCIQNWRPIVMLNTSYKIIVKLMISQRLRKLIPHMISQ